MRRELGAALDASADRVAAAVLSRLLQSGVVDAIGADPELMEAIARTDVEATRVFARWVATGEPASGEEMDRLGGLGVMARRLPLCDLVKAYLAWRDAIEAALDDQAERLGASPGLRAEIGGMIARSCDASLVRMARRFDRQREGLQDQLEQMALHDPLTGLANRRLLEARLAEAVTACRRNGDSLAIAFVDLDGFKRVNDAFGHEAGDQLLRALADRLRAMTASADTAARVGGDEFVVLRARPAGDSAAEFADRILARTEEPCAVAGHRVRITASVGVALGDGESEPASLLSRADALMYRAKRRGGSRVELPATAPPHRAHGAELRALPAGRPVPM